MIEFLADWAIRSSILIACGALLLFASRTRDASMRLAAWTAVLCGSLAIPFLGAALPRLPLVLRHADARPAVPAGFKTTPVTASDSDAGITVPAPVSRPFYWARLVDWPRAAGMLYALITAALLLRICVGLAMSRRLLRGSRATELAGIRESDWVGAPVTLGVVMPVVVLPEDWREWDHVKLDAVLAHERSHIERWDPAVQLLSAMYLSLLWVSPLSWMLDRWIVRAAEEASDDAAVAATADRASYAEVLLEFVARGATPLGIGMARYGRPDKRIDRILDGTSISSGVTRWSVAAILILGCPLAYVASAASPQNERAMRFPALPAPPAAPAPPVLIAQAQTSTLQPRPAVPQRPPTFDVVSIKPLPPGGRGPGNPPPQCPPLRYTTGLVSGFATVSRLIQDAYGLSPHQISGGPGWLDSDLYCIEAKSAGPAEQDQLKLMLQPMLADRFKLVTRHETKEMPVYIMTVAKKGLLLEIKPGDPTIGLTTQELKAAGYEFRTHIDESLPTSSLMTRNTMQGFATLLSSSTPLALGGIDRPVVDKTGLQGRYLLAWRWAGEDFKGALEEQFGLRLDPSKAPLPAVAIESIQRPDPN